MWNALASGLATGATIVLFDGAPLQPDPRVLWRMAHDERITIFGTSPRFLATCEQARHPAAARVRSRARCARSSRPARRSTRRAIDYVYREVKPDVQLASITGGTDLMACFGARLPDPAGLRRRDSGAQPRHEDRGLRRCRQAAAAASRASWSARAPFPSVPIGFWGDTDGSRFHGDLFRALSERLVARRPRDDHAARRPDRARPLRRGAESRRRAHRHRRDLSPGREDRGSRRIDRHRASSGKATCASCCSSGCATA